jgi:tetratricopeptide (TPR) repeat protein
LRWFVAPTFLMAAAVAHTSTASASAASGASPQRDDYVPPSAEELAPLRPAYLLALKAIHEPPEIASKEMKPRHALDPTETAALKVLSMVPPSPASAPRAQSEESVQKLLALARDRGSQDPAARSQIFGAVAPLSCFAGEEPSQVIAYANNGDPAEWYLVALRAKMNFLAGDKKRSLDDLELLMRGDHASALTDGRTEPRKGPWRCGWSLDDFAAFGSDPRAIAAKAFYLSSFISFGAEEKGTVSESDIRDLYAQSAERWNSPVPHYLVARLGGFGSRTRLESMRCVRGLPTATAESVAACADADAVELAKVRELNMALIIEPNFAPALIERAERYLTLGESRYADNKPSRQFLELALKDFVAAQGSHPAESDVAFCDGAMTQALLGRYLNSVGAYKRCIGRDKGGPSTNPFVYEQLASVYMKLGRPNDAANTLTMALMNGGGGGLDVVTMLAGSKPFRALYPEYDTLPDAILADVVRRRFYPQFPQSWNSTFIRKSDKVTSSVLADLYAMRGDAYMRAKRYSEARADYQRLKSDAWGGPDQYLPRNLYFEADGSRRRDVPQPWPPAPPTR